MSPPVEQRVVAAAFGATAVWRALSGVAALGRWLWLGAVVGNGSMSLLLTSVVVGPIVGAVAGDAALRREFWAQDRPASRRRIWGTVALLVAPFVATRLAGVLLGGRPASLPLYGAVTISVTTVVLIAVVGSGSNK